MLWGNIEKEEERETGREMKMETLFSGAHKSKYIFFMLLSIRIMLVLYNIYFYALHRPIIYIYQFLNFVIFVAYLVEDRVD